MHQLHSDRQSDSLHTQGHTDTSHSIERPLLKQHITECGLVAALETSPSQLRGNQAGCLHIGWLWNYL